MASVVLIHAVGVTVGGGLAELETRGGFVERLQTGDLVDDDIQVVSVIIVADVFIQGEDIRELVF